MNYINPVTGEEQDTNPDTGITDFELEKRYAEMLDETYGMVTIGTSQFETSRALKELDPIMYNEGLLDFEDFYARGF